MAVDKGGKSALALSRELGLRYDAAWLMHHKIQWAMTDRNARYQLAGLVELDDAYFGGVSHGAGKRGRGTDQDPVVVGVSLNEKGHPQYAFLEVVESLKQDTVLEVLKRRVDESGIWLSDGAAAYAAGAKTHHADHRVTLSSDPEASEVFHWINTVISLAKTFIDGTYHGRGRARRQLYLEEFMYRFNRRHMETGVADRLLIACVTSHPHPNAV
jgi:transposase-like protein